MARKKFNLTDHFIELFDVFKHERRGVLFFGTLIVLVLLLNYSLSFWVKAPKIDTSQLDSLIAARPKPVKEKIFTPNAIEVNAADTSDWMQLGFSKRQVSVILNYKDAIGGAFRSTDQVQNIFIIDSFKYRQIRPYLNIKEIQVEEDSVYLTTAAEKRQEPFDDEIAELKFAFDPNKISYDSLILLGFYSSQATSLIKFREKIKFFQSPEDLLELYLYDNSDHSKYAKYIEIDSGYSKSHPNDFRAKKPERVWEVKEIELNTADTSDLEALYGIGAYSASRIVQYRNQLGGFYSADQLYEVKGIRKETLDNLFEGFLVDTTVIKKININTCSFKEMLTHPYFDYYETKLLFDYRNEQGKFIYLQDLKKVDPLPDYFIDKVGHYLIFE